MTQSTFPFTDIDPDCTCGPDCESICIGWCGCKACYVPHELPDDWIETTTEPRGESMSGKCLPVTTWTELRTIMGRVG
jgi:hypothetical protein